MCTIMYTSHTYVLSAGNNCFPVKMLQKDSLFTFQRRLKLDLGLSVPSQFCYKDHKINASAITKFQCLIYITCFSVSIVGKKKSPSRKFTIRYKWKYGKVTSSINEFACQGDYFLFYSKKMLLGINSSIT